MAGAPTVCERGSRSRATKLCEVAFSALPCGSNLGKIVDLRMFGSRRGS